MFKQLKIGHQVIWSKVPFENFPKCLLLKISLKNKVLFENQLFNPSSKSVGILALCLLTKL
jgi:hypothetical protein